MWYDLLMQQGLHWFGSQPTPYNDVLFREISRRFKNFQVTYRIGASRTHPWKTPLAQGYRSRAFRLRLGVDWQSIKLGLCDRNAFFMVAGWNSPTSILLLSILCVLRRKFAVWTDTPNVGRERGWFKSRLRSAWLRWIFRGAVATLSTGRPGVENLARMGAPALSIVNFPFVLDLERYRRTDWQPARDRSMRFISSGRVWNPQKGHDIAVRALANAYRRTGQRFEYFIAGTGPDLEAVRQLASAQGVADMVHCRGWVETSDLADCMRRSDVLLHPSPTHDPFPNAVLEGMAAGLAILGSDVSGSVLDRVQDGAAGFVHRAGDLPQLTQHVVWCLENPERVAEMGRKAEMVAAKWPVQRSIEILDNLLGR